MNNFESINKIVGKSKLTKKDIKTVKDFLEMCSNSYYNTSELIISDKEFDQLYKQFREKTGEVLVGAEAPEGKRTISVEHTYRELVGTLDKAQNMEDLEKWFNRVSYGLGVDYETLEVCATLKFDGNSVVIQYKDGKVVKALTRGKNGKGVDLTDVFKNHTINSKGNYGIKYEVIVTYENFNKLIEDTGVKYVNPRSLVSGLLGRDDAKDFYKYMTLVPLWVKEENKDMTKNDQILFIDENFGGECELFREAVIIDLDSKSEILNKIEDFYNRLTKERVDLPFMIDGIVIEIMDETIKKELGYVQDEPRWAIALKFPYLEEKTVVTDMDFCFGDSGIITPRVWFEPVKFFGSEHTKQSINNYKRFKELQLGIGTELLVQYRNDCLTYVQRLDNEFNKNIKSIDFPEVCPKCGEPIVINDNETFAMCVNNSCPGKIVGKVQNYLTKMDIKGVKEATLQKLNEAELLNSIESLYTMDYTKVAEIEGLGDITAKNMQTSINEKVPFDYEILGSIGIDNVSLETAKVVCKEFTLFDLMEMNTENPNGLYWKLYDMNGFSDIMIRHLMNGLKSNNDLIVFLLNRQHKLFIDEISNNIDEVTYNFVFTGFRDKSIQQQLELRGHKITGSVSSKTDIVVAAKPNENSSKLNKARDLGKEILSVEEFKERFIK